MIPTIDLPADIVWPTPRLGVAIVQGDPVEDWHGEDGLTFVTPSAWEFFDKPCETCGGYPLTGVNQSNWHNGVRRCPDCRDGRQVWELRTECWSCDGAGNWLDVPARPGDPPIERDDCAECDDSSGSVPVARCAVHVVPVVAEHDPEPSAPYVVVLPNNVWLIDHDEPHIIKCDPLPVPGRDFGVVLREVRS